MKKHLIVLLAFFLLSACASPTPTADMPKPTDTPLVIPTRMPFPTRVSTLAASPNLPVPTPTIQPGLLEGVKFLTQFSSVKADWQIIPGYVTAAQVNAALARQEGDQINRVNQKVLNGFLRAMVAKSDGQSFEVLLPAELVNGKLQQLTVKSVEQTPALSSYAVLLEDYFAINFPDAVDKWQAQGAQYEDFKYAAVVTVAWATKYGPLWISYMLSGKYISEEGKYPGRIDFLRLCMYEQTKEHFTPTNKLMPNLYPVPIIGVSGAAGKMESDAFGWTPMVDFATAENTTLSAIAQAVSGVTIDSKESLAQLQAAFDRAFMPVHCTETVIE